MELITELDTIKSEHEFMRVGDPVPVNMFDDHDQHIEEHKKLHATLKNENKEVFVQHFIEILDTHIELHRDMKERI